MPTFQITGPDGKKYRVKGDNADGAYEALQSHLGEGQTQPQATPQTPNMAELSQMTMNPDFSGEASKELNRANDQQANRAAYEAMPAWKKPFVAANDMANIAATGVTGGLINSLAAGIRAPFTDKSYSQELDALNQQLQASRDRAGSAGVVGEIGANVYGVGKLAKAGGTAAKLIPQGLTGAKAKIAAMLAGSADGLAINEAMNVGAGNDFGENTGAAALLGGAAPMVGAVGSKAVDYGKSILGVGNKPRAQQAVLEGIKRSGRSIEDISADLMQSVDDGQGVYTLADALGNSGQRMLSGIARSPGDSRQVIAEALMSRQSGQADRLTNALVEGFDAPMTAAQKQAAMVASRKAQAKVNYGQAREGAGPVDVSGAIQEADNFLMPGANSVISNPAGIAENSVEGLVSRAKAYLTDGKSQLSDFDATFRAKREIDKMIKANPDVGELIGIRNALDDSLAAASPKYTNARDTFRQGKVDEEALVTGQSAQSGRVRSQDSIPAFNAMKPSERAAFRTGYVDPTIAKIQASSGDMTNKARMLRSDKAKAEFPAFVAQGKGDQLSRRVDREMVMSKTMNDALGGSKTFDNMQDGAEMAGIDPSMVGNILRGNFTQAALNGVTKLANAATGKNAATRDMIAKALMSTGKDAPKQIMEAVKSGKQLTQKQMIIARMLMGGSIPMLANSNAQ